MKNNDRAANILYFIFIKRAAVRFDQAEVTKRVNGSNGN